MGAWQECQKGSSLRRAAVEEEKGNTHGEEREG